MEKRRTRRHRHLLFFFFFARVTKPPPTPFLVSYYCVTRLETSCSIFQHVNAASPPPPSHIHPSKERKKSAELFSWYLIHSNTHVHNQWFNKPISRTRLTLKWRRQTIKLKKLRVLCERLTFNVESDGPIDFRFRVDLTFVQALGDERSSIRRRHNTTRNKEMDKSIKTR